MAVWMAGVEVIDGHPVELRTEVLLSLCHQPSDHWLQILVFGAILRGDDEPELVAVASAAFEERLAIGIIQLGGVERPAFACSGGAVALKVAEMRDCSLGAAAG